MNGKLFETEDDQQGGAVVSSYQRRPPLQFLRCDLTPVCCIRPRYRVRHSLGVLSKMRDWIYVMLFSVIILPRYDMSETYTGTMVLRDRLRDPWVHDERFRQRVE